ncbi:MAG: hypothetical protein ACR2QT_08210 [Woeseiaceae bacterium]
MNSNVHPAIAALVLATTAIAVALWMWGTGVAGGFGGPAELKVSPNGHSFVQIQNYLVEHDTNGEYLETHDLGKWDVELFLGGFGFFSNGDILLRRGADTRSFLDNVRAYKRETNQTSIVPDSPDQGLFRCNLDTSACERFGKEGIDFKAAHGVFIDWQTDEVYISDTTRHLLRKYSATGVELATPVDGFQFPNQLMLHDGQLLVADTNHHVIRRLESQSSSFAESIDRKDVLPMAAKSAQHNWPSHFAPVGDEWWVNNMQTGMNRGGLYVFDNDWRYVRRIELPADADPISILTVGDAVWVSDWNNDVVRRFSMAGEPLSDLESAGLETVLATSRLERRKYNMFGYAGVAAVALMFIVLIAQSLVRGTNNKTAQRSAKDDSVESGDGTESLHLEPDARAKKRMMAAAWLVGLLMLVAVVASIFVFAELENPGALVPLIGLFAVMSVIAIMIAWTNRANWGTVVSVEGNTVTLRDYTGRQSSCPIRDVRYDGTAIATRDAVVILGRPNARVYTSEEVEDQLMPRLGDAQKVGPLAMLLIQIQLRHPQGIFVVLALIGLLAYGVVQLVS